MTLEEYELYELTKPSFKLNVNFSTEAKHRDPVETLVLGRRVEGMIRGGDTPEKTLWKYHTQGGGAYFAGEMQISGDNCEISVYGVNQTTYYVLNEQGAIQGANSLNVEMLLNEIKSAAELSKNKQVVSIAIIPSEYNVGDILSDFNSYLDIS